jgi:hypothetical protein
MTTHSVMCCHYLQTVRLQQENYIRVEIYQVQNHPYATTKCMVQIIKGINIQDRGF